MAADEGTTWLTVTDLARRLGRPESTVRYWRNSYREALAARIDSSGHTTYALAQFEVIATMIGRGASHPEIARVLTDSGADVGERAATLAGQAAGPVAEVLTELKSIRSLLERIADRLDPPTDGR